jgi:hypothetical protein
MHAFVWHTFDSFVFLFRSRPRNIANRIVAIKNKAKRMLTTIKAIDFPFIFVKKF